MLPRFSFNIDLISSVNAPEGGRQIKLLAMSHNQPSSHTDREGSSWMKVNYFIYVKKKVGYGLGNRQEAGGYRINPGYIQ